MTELSKNDPSNEVVSSNNNGFSARCLNQGLYGEITLR